MTRPDTVATLPAPTAAGQDEQSRRETMSTTSAAAGRYAGQAQLDAAVTALWHAARATRPELPELPPGINARYPAEPMPTTAAALATSILREGVHELAAARGVTVTSRGGRYHNKTFAQLAAELGLAADGDYKAPGGWSKVSLLDETAERYAAELDGIDRVLAEHPLPAAAEQAPKRSTETRRVAAVCGCTPPHRIWLSRSLLDQQVVLCGDCARAGRDPWFVDAATLGV